MEEEVILNLFVQQALSTKVTVFMRKTQHRLAILATLEKPRTPLELSRIVGCHNTTVYRALRLMEARGEVRRVANSKLWERNECALLDQPANV